MTQASLPMVASLCRQLDGLPLALEMAVARLPLMGLQTVHDARAERFALLSRGRRDSPARHRRLHAAMDWRYGLLDAPERRHLRALGVFAGGFTLATLVERSLVSVSVKDIGEETRARPSCGPVTMTLLWRRS